MFRLTGFYLSPKSRPLTRLAVSKLAITSILIILALSVFARSPASKESSLQVQLGLRLFRDNRFSSPKGDLQNSCSSCHLIDEDPQGMRVHTDFFARSWVPFRGDDPRREELRNSPTILDSAMMPRLHFDGEFSSLEALVKGTLAGRPMGWLPGEEVQAFENLLTEIRKDTGQAGKAATSYASQFKAAYGADIETLSGTEIAGLVAKAMSDYVRTLKTARTTAYDRFAQKNGLESGPPQGDDAARFANRLLANLASLEQSRKLKLIRGFDATALKGMKLFFSTDGSGSAGNCVMCHTPPLFTDLSFHNMGISQSEYDQVNGEGRFAELEIPTAAVARRPSTQFRETPSKRKPDCADLGHWNFVDLKNSPLRHGSETDDQFLQRMIGAFKTPTIRDLAFSQPYMHTGGFTSLESALGELMRLSELARNGKVRSGDEQLARIKISENDIAPLAAFLTTLNDDLKPAKKY